MNKRDKKRNELKNYKLYHIPSCANYVKRTKNAIHLNTHNNIKHEMKKLEVCYELQKEGSVFITEASRNIKRGETAKVVDVVDLTSGFELEVIFKHESDQEIKEYRENGVLPIIVQPMICELCNKSYPKRTKKNICMLCKKEVKK